MHIPRTSGTSIESSFRVNLDNLNYQKHLRASQIKKIVGENVWLNAFKFSIIRNPWERVISLYHQKAFASINVISRKSLYYFLKNYEPKSWENGYTCSDYLDEDLDFIAKFEERENDLKFVSDKIGISLINNKHERKGKKNKNWNFYYNEKTFEIVSNLFKNDIKRFNYDESFFFRKVFQRKSLFDFRSIF